MSRAWFDRVVFSNQTVGEWLVPGWNRVVHSACKSEKEDALWFPVEREAHSCPLLMSGEDDAESEGYGRRTAREVMCSDLVHQHGLAASLNRSVLLAEGSVSAPVGTGEDIWEEAGKKLFSEANEDAALDAGRSDVGAREILFVPVSVTSSGLVLCSVMSHRDDPGRIADSLLAVFGSDRGGQGRLRSARMVFDMPGRKCTAVYILEGGYTLVVHAHSIAKTDRTTFKTTVLKQDENGLVSIVRRVEVEDLNTCGFCVLRSRECLCPKSMQHADSNSAVATLNSYEKAKAGSFSFESWENYWVSIRRMYALRPIARQAIRVFEANGSCSFVCDQMKFSSIRTGNRPNRPQSHAWFQSFANHVSAHLQHPMLDIHLAASAFEAVRTSQESSCGRRRASLSEGWSDLSRKRKSLSVSESGQAERKFKKSLTYHAKNEEATGGEFKSVVKAKEKSVVHGVYRVQRDSPKVGSGSAEVGAAGSIVEVHRKTGAIRCDQCGKEFKQTNHLREHVRTVHERNCPFVCSFCDRAFGFKSNLKKHIHMIHLAPDERAFQCETCSKTYKSKGKLVRHTCRGAPKTASS